MSYIYACIICAEINRSYYSHGSRYHYNLRLYAHVMPVCSIDAPAVSGVILELWPSVIRCLGYLHRMSGDPPAKHVVVLHECGTWLFRGRNIH